VTYFLKGMMWFIGFAFGMPLVFGQHPVTRSDLWQIGESIQFFGYLAEGVEPGPAGNGVTWRFPNLQRDPDRESSFTYVDPAGVAGADLFPDANLAARTEFEPQGFLYVFSRINDEEILDYGQITPVGSVVFEDPRLVLTFPLAYNASFVDTFRGILSVTAGGSTVTGERTGQIEVLYDGFGTLEVGSKTYTQVRRMKQVQTVTDTFMFNGETTEATSITTTYAYLGRESGTAIFQYHIIELINNGIRTVSRTISAQDVEPAEAQPLNGPQGVHLTAQSGTFETQIILNNASENSQSLMLTPRSSDGGNLPAVPVDLPARSVTRVAQTSLFPATAASFAINGCDTCSISLGYRSVLEGGSTAQVHQTAGASNSYLFYPGEWDLLFDGAAMVNTGTEPAIIEASQLAGDGTLIQKVTLVDGLPPGGKFLDVFNGTFAQQANTLLKIESNQPLAVMILRISQDNRFLYQNSPLPTPMVGSKRWLTHLTSGSGGFKTQLLFHNTSGSDKMLTLQPYDATGLALEPRNVLIPGGWTRQFDKEELLPAAATHMAVSGSVECIVSVGYQSILPLASTAQIHETTATDSAIEIYPGEWDLLFDGLAIINSGSEMASLTAIQVDDSGDELGRVILAQELPPNGKYLGVLEGLLPSVPGSRIRIEASQPIAVLTLRLSKDSRYLYRNVPIP